MKFVSDLTRSDHGFRATYTMVPEDKGKQTVIIRKFLFLNKVVVAFMAKFMKHSVDDKNFVSFSVKSKFRLSGSDFTLRSHLPHL